MVVGNGNTTNPYQICSIVQFNQYATFYPITSSYKLCVNLDFANATLVPFGNLTHPFEGEFDGNNMKITNYLFDFPTSIFTEYVGLFRSTAGAFIHDLYIQTALSNYNRVGTLQNLRYVGALIGTSNGKVVNGTVKQTVVKNINANINVLVPNDYYNGIFGYINNTHVYNCFFNITNIIGYGSDAVNSILYISENSVFNNLYVTTQLSFVGNPQFFDSSISYSSAGFGIASKTNFTDIFYTFNVQLPKFNKNTPVNLGAFSGYLRDSMVTNVFFSGKFTVNNNSYNIQIGKDNNVSIGYISGSQFNSKFLNNVFFVNV